MPCYEPRGNDYFQMGAREAPRTSYIPDPEKDEKIKALEAALCAITTELESRGIAHEVLTKAGREGQIDLMGFWAKHSAEDWARVAKKLHKFSVHEQEIIKKLLA